MDALSAQTVGEIARRVAERVLPPGSVLDVSSALGEDWMGDPVWRVKVVIRQDALDAVVHSAGSDLSFKLQEELRTRGEGRLAFVGWQTDRERAAERERAAHYGGT